MCGICGFSQPDGAVDKTRFEEMVDLIAYRGPDDRGSFYEGGLALGHRRLAILDLSPAGAQPFIYKDLVIIYNGEIYNYLELQKELAQHGYTFSTSCDTEVLAAAYDFYGDDCVRHFNGMWAFCIYDRTQNRLFCSRDRFGIKPLYYFLQDDRFCFASEIKQLLLWQQGEPRACHAALERFLVLGELDENERTLFDGILQLVPGHNLVFDLASRALSSQCYFTLDSVENDNLPYEDACQLYGEVFTEAVSFRLRADVNVGSCLSGGIDSSAIVGMIHKLLQQQGKADLQHTISSCYEDPQYNEQEFIDYVLRDTGAVSHKVYPQIDDGTEWLDTLIWHMDEPLPSSSPYSQWCVFEEAQRQNLTVMLDGQGADEQLAGYSQFYLVYFVELLRARRFTDFKRELEAYRVTREALQPVSTFSVKMFCYAAAFLPKGLSRFLNSLFIRFKKSKVFSQKGWAGLLLDSPQYTVPTTREYIRQNITGHLRQLLHLEDRNSMAHGIEARVPFLDPSLVQAAWQMPFGFKIRDGVSKAALRDGLRDVLPPEIYGRHSKMGFPAPEMDFIRANREWFTQELRHACALFPHLLDEDTVLPAFEAYCKAPQAGEFVFWRIMSLSRWAKLFHVQA